MPQMGPRVLALLGMASVVAGRQILFGDSYTDKGNIFAVTGGAFPAMPPYCDGALSNGLMWWEHIVEQDGVDEEVVSFAVAAGTTTAALSPTFFPASLADQVAAYIATGPPPLSDEVSIITGKNDGANFFAAADGTSVTDFLTLYASELGANLQTLMATQPNTVYVWGSSIEPEEFTTRVGQLPALEALILSTFGSLEAGLAASTQLSAGIDSTTQAVIAQLRQALPCADIRYMDLNSVIRKTVDQAVVEGLDVTTPCMVAVGEAEGTLDFTTCLRDAGIVNTGLSCEDVSGTTVGGCVKVCDDPDSYLFFDGTPHFSDKGHEIAAAFMLEAYVDSESPVDASLCGTTTDSAPVPGEDPCTLACASANPNEPCMTDSSCANGGLGCNALGQESCRFCEFARFENISCSSGDFGAEDSEESEESEEADCECPGFLPSGEALTCVRDPSCARGGLGCNAGGELLCRFCGSGRFDDC